MPYAGPLLSLAFVIACAHLGGLLFAALRQPRVIGEVVAGIALGPSLLGALAPDAAAWLLPEASEGFLDAVAQLGLVVFMLLVGLEIDLRLLRARRRLIGAVAAGSVSLPLALGLGFGFVLRPDDPAFALFLGLALAVTAMPVLARIIKERGLGGTSLGAIALACAALNDVAAWLGLAGVTALIGEGEVWIAVAGLVALAPALVAFRALLRRAGPELRLPLLLAGALAAGAVTDEIGLHLVIGRFLVGLVAPRDERTPGRLEPLALAVLMPAFFLTAGAGVQLNGLAAGDLLLLAVALVLAFAGKFAGTALPARRMGLSTNESLRLGALMNTRGITDIVLLGIGLELGVLDTRLYSILVVTALVTTIATGPILNLLGQPRPPRRTSPAPVPT
ncbi:cation:proton antiporter [Solirubrobacter deserti]|nr:cation:proton antiporter [Solirubrobacter deserti]